MGIAAGKWQQHRHRRAERGDLRQRQVDEDHAAFDDVHAEVGVNTGQDQARDKRRREELQDGGSKCMRLPAGQLFQRAGQQIDVVVEQRDVIARFLDAAH